MTPAELGKHGTSLNTYPPTQVGKDGRFEPCAAQGSDQSRKAVPSGV